MAVLMPEPQNTQLGKHTVYRDHYDPSLLEPISRSLGRDAIADHDFRGCDIWRLYELSWLNPQGMPQTAVGELIVPASTPSIIESKSLKLYAGSFAMTSFESRESVALRMRQDLSRALGGAVEIRLYAPEQYPGSVRAMPGLSLDKLAASLEPWPAVYETDPSLLAFDSNTTGKIAQTYSTTVFRSLCPVTGQPDLASVLIRYEGRAVDPKKLLQYLVSYRRHKGFHEQCVEQIFHDLRAAFAPDLLEVYACFTRRGGIDINPFRSSTREMPSEILREMRQ